MQAQTKEKRQKTKQVEKRLRCTKTTSEKHNKDGQGLPPEGSKAKRSQLRAKAKIPGSGSRSQSPKRWKTTFGL
jgi:hypothetical protein